MKQRRKILHLLTPDSELELSTAVDIDAPIVAEIVSVEQALESSETRGLEVDYPWLMTQSADIFERVNRSIPSYPIKV